MLMENVNKLCQLKLAYSKGCQLITYAVRPDYSRSIGPFKMDCLKTICVIRKINYKIYIYKYCLETLHHSRSISTIPFHPLPIPNIFYLFRPFYTIPYFIFDSLSSSVIPQHLLEIQLPIFLYYSLTSSIVSFNFLSFATSRYHSPSFYNKKHVQSP